MRGQPLRGLELICGPLPMDGRTGRAFWPAAARLSSISVLRFTWLNGEAQLTDSHRYVWWFHVEKSWPRPTSVEENGPRHVPAASLCVVGFARTSSTASVRICVNSGPAWWVDRSGAHHRPSENASAGPTPSVSMLTEPLAGPREPPQTSTVQVVRAAGPLLLAIAGSALVPL